MKNLQLVIVAIILLGYVSSIKDIYTGEDLKPILFDNKQRWAYPRSNTSCSAPEDKSELYEDVTNIFGWFWDGQSCQPCAHPYCRCSEYRSCEKCIDGYAKIDKSTPINYFTEQDERYSTCFQCPTLETSEYLDDLPMKRIDGYQKPTTEFFDGKDPAGLKTGNFEVEQCKIFFNTELDNKWFEKKYEGEMENYKWWRQGFQAIECSNGSYEDGIKVVKYGSICWYIVGCSSYNKWGRCNTCFDGYYLNENQYCEKCKSTCTVEWDGDLVKSDCQKTGGCNKCQNGNTCDECAPGYWQAGPIFFDNDMTDKRIDRTDAIIETLLDFNACVKCPEGCECSLLSDFTKFGTGSFTLTPKIGYYKDQNQCLKCSTISEGCSTCSSGTGGSDAKCISCKSANNKFYVPTPVGEKTCLSCPPNCYECERKGEESSCLPNKCFNGFRPEYKTKGNTQYTKCIPCQAQNAARCRTEKDQEVITQCRTEVNQGTNANDKFDTEQRNGYEQPALPRMNFDPPSSLDYLLIPRDDNNQNQCVKNVKLCKQMDEDTQNCKTCYTDKGYYLTVQKTCAKCNIDNCKTCDGSKSPAACSTCFTGYNPIGNQCQKCEEVKENCAECSYKDGSYTCKTCMAGYKLEGGKCNPCIIQNCSDCSKNINSCTSCKERFVLWGKTSEQDADPATEQKNLVCETCEPGCLTCDTDTRKVCTKCQANLYLHGGVCHERLANCVEFSGSEEGSHKCKWCKYGYRLTGDGVCVRCFSPDLGATHCPEYCEGDTCWYSTVNDLNLIVDESETTE